MVFTCEFPHPTPADCASHFYNRRNYDVLAPQIAYNNLNVVFGGGNDFVSDDMKAHLERTGTTYLQNDKQGMLNYQGDKIWALFKPKAMSYDIDRDPEKEPSLAEMTQKALDILNQNKKGFFLMVEGSQVDWAAHANDPTGMITEFLAFDEAVKVVMDFAKKDGKTSVVILPDHGNSGFSINRTGAKRKDRNWQTLEDLFGTVSQIKRTSAGLEEILKETPQDKFKSVFKYYTNIDLTDDDVELLLSSKNYTLEDYTKPKDSKNMSRYINQILNEHLPFGFTHTSHTGEEVFLATYHPKGDILTGNVINTDLHKYLYKLSGLKLSMQEHTARAFAKHTDVFKGMKCKIVPHSEHLSKLVVEHDNNILEIPASSSVVTYNGHPIQLESVVVYMDNVNTFYLPKNLKDITFGKKLKK